MKWMISVCSEAYENIIYNQRNTKRFTKMHPTMLKNDRIGQKSCSKVLKSKLSAHHIIQAKCACKWSQPKTVGRKQKLHSATVINFNANVALHTLKISRENLYCKQLLCLLAVYSFVISVMWNIFFVYAFAACLFILKRLKPNLISGRLKHIYTMKQPNFEQNWLVNNI